MAHPFPLAPQTHSQQLTTLVLYLSTLILWLTGSVLWFTGLRLALMGLVLWLLLSSFDLPSTSSSLSSHRIRLVSTASIPLLNGWSLVVRCLSLVVTCVGLVVRANDRESGGKLLLRSAILSLYPRCGESLPSTGPLPSLSGLDSLVSFYHLAAPFFDLISRLPWFILAWNYPSETVGRAVAVTSWTLSPLLFELS